MNLSQMAEKLDKLRSDFLFEDVEEFDALSPLAQAEAMRAFAYMAAAVASLRVADLHETAALGAARMGR